MNVAPDLEDRLRRGLREAAAHLPEARPAPPTEKVVSVRPAPVVTTRIRVLAAAAYTAAAALFVFSAVLTLFVDDSENVKAGGEDEVPVTTVLTTTTTTPSAPHVPSPSNGMVPGQAVVVGTELRTYGPDGVQTGTVSLAMFDEGVSTVASDLAGGWVACGFVSPEEEDSVDRAARLVWFPEDGEPVVLATESDTLCGADAIRVVDSPEGATVVFRRDPTGPSPYAEPGLGTIVLATGDEGEIDVPLRTDDRWSAATGVVVTVNARGQVHLWALAGGDGLTATTVGGAVYADSIALAPDIGSLAVLDGTSGKLTIYDLASGEVVFQESVEVGTDGAQLSYDGTVVAVGNAEGAGSGVVHVFDIAAGTSRTLEVSGLLP